MLRDEFGREYFKWMTDLVCGKRYAKSISYRKLLTFLHNTEFIYSIPKDVNRAKDGVDLRYRFTLSGFTDDVPEYYDDIPCSVLEMMVALSIRCEENIMSNPDIGDRTGQWFWGMIVNLGLGSMTDDRFDENYVDYVVTRFLDREYDPDGRGGLFRIKNCKRDLRNVEIWYQLNWYLGGIT